MPVKFLSSPCWLIDLQGAEAPENWADSIAHFKDEGLARLELARILEDDPDSKATVARGDGPCVVASCKACGADLEDYEWEYRIHVTDLTEMRRTAAEYEWTLSAAGGEAWCQRCAPEGMNPVPVIPGQETLPLLGDPR